MYVCVVWIMLEYVDCIPLRKVRSHQNNRFFDDIKLHLIVSVEF